MKKIICFIMNITLVTGLMFGFCPIDTYAKSQNEVVSQLNSLVAQYNGKTANSNQMYMGSQCKGFANWVFLKIFGVYIGPYPEAANYKITNPNAQTLGILEPGNLNVNTAKALLQKGAPGDYIQVQRSTARGRGPHSMILCGVNADGIEVFDANSDGRNTIKKYAISWSSFDTANRAMSLYRAHNYTPDPVPDIHNPKADLDFVNPIPGGIEVRGWAFDRDDLSKALWVHVYVGGPSGSGAKGYAIQANAHRPDVNAVYPGVGEYHGFSSRISTSVRGTQTVYLYVINEGAGSNIFLGSREVVIPNDNEKPVISNVKITDLDKTGYTVSCKVTDNMEVARVAFAVWTAKNSQDDLLSGWQTDKRTQGVKNGDVYTFRVKTEDHNNEGGLYHTHIYAWDMDGNIGFAGADDIIVDKESPIISNVKITDLNETGYTVSCKVTDNAKVDRVAFPTWTVNGGQDDLIPEWWKNEKARGSKNGDTYTYRVNIADHKNERGLYMTHIYAWDASKNETAYTGLFDIKVESCAEKGHSYGEWKVTKAATCTVSGTRERICTSCKKTETQTIAATGHKMGSWTVTKEATESSEGLKTRSCANCGKTETKIMPKIDPDPCDEHEFGEWEETEEATCTESGVEERVCEICGETETRTVPATGHEMGDWAVTKEATESSVGEKTRTCLNCEKIETEVIPNTDPNPNPCDKNGHTYGEWEEIEKATCTAKGTEERVCEICDETETRTVPAAGHKMGSWVVTKEATESSAGERTRACSICKKTETQTIPATKPSDEDDDEVEIITKPIENTDEKSHPSTGGQTDTQPSQPQPLKKGSFVIDESSDSLYKVTISKAVGGTVEYRKPQNTKLTSITIPSSIEVNGIKYKVTSIGANAFKNRKKLKTAEMGGNIKTIGSQAFSGCTNLRSVTIGNNVTAIGAKAFYKCTKITAVTIPAKVNKIGQQAFFGCRQLKDITIKTKKLTLKKVGGNAFKGIHKKVRIKVPKSKLNSYRQILKKRGIKL